MALKVQEQSQEVLAMAEGWAVAEALCGGTPAMRRAGPAYLPKWPNEDADSYKARVATATLFPAFARTVNVMSGKPLSKQVTLGDDVPKRIVAWCDDADLQGNSLHAFCAQLMPEVMAYGLCGVLVDYPTVGGVKTQAEEAKLGARPYLVLVQHSQILGWRAERSNGIMRLVQLRLAETAEIPDGLYGTVTKKRVRVLQPGSWELWEEDEKTKEYTLIEGGTTTLQAVPFVPFYGRRTGFMTGQSPLIDVAYLNVKHWQSQSDQDTILHVARVPILAMIGAEPPTPDGGGTQLTVGASSAVNLPADADLKYVEHSGKAIEAGEKALGRLEHQMVQTGAELLVIKPGEQKTATQAGTDAEASKCDLQRIVETFEDSLDQVLQFMAEWVKEPDGGHATLFKDFGAASLSDVSAELIIALRDAGLITRETALREQQRRGVLSPEINPATEIKAAEKEPPASTATPPKKLEVTPDGRRLDQ